MSAKILLKFNRAAEREMRRREEGEEEIGWEKVEGYGAGKKKTTD